MGWQVIEQESQDGVNLRIGDGVIIIQHQDQIAGKTFNSLIKAVQMAFVGGSCGDCSSRPVF
jgi:hypothetical protein